MAKNKATQPYIRATAMAVVGRVGGKEQIAEMESFLTDTTLLGQSQFGTVRIQTEMRDVALAMMVQLSGQQAVDYGFPYLNQPALRANPQEYLLRADDARLQRPPRPARPLSKPLERLVGSGEEEVRVDAPDARVLKPHAGRPGMMSAEKASGRLCEESSMQDGSFSFALHEPRPLGIAVTCDSESAR